MLRAMATKAAPLQLVTYRGMLHAEGCTLSGRVLRRPLHGGPRSDDGWWRNLRNTWRRFDSEPVAGVAVELGFRGARGVARSDEEGYWSLTLPGGAPAQSPWEIAEARPTGQDKVFLQPVLCVPADASFGVLSDIDDTVLESNVTDWQTAAQLTFLHNARTRKPLEGVAGLYQALQKGRDGQGFNPLFYVSASPWNLYDLLEDFLTLNDIPPGPLMLRDVDLDRVSWRGDTQAQSKVESMELLMRRYPGWSCASRDASWPSTSATSIRRRIRSATASSTATSAPSRAPACRCCACATATPSRRMRASSGCCPRRRCPRWRRKCAPTMRGRSSRMR